MHLLFVWLAAALGVVLRSWQYAADTSLWLDELALLAGLLDSDLVALMTSPLPFEQVAPKGFLLLQKLTVEALGPSDYAVRLVPFTASVAAVIAFSHLAIRMLGKRSAAAAVLIFATGATFVDFGSLAKQYSTDVCAAIVLTSAAFDMLVRPLTRARTGWFALVGFLAAWLSQPAALVIAGVALPLAIHAMSAAAPDVRRRVVVVLAAWFLSAGLATIVGFQTLTPMTEEQILAFWARGFPPAGQSLLAKVVWPWGPIKTLLAGGQPVMAGFGYPWPALFAGLVALGLWLLAGRDVRVTMLLAGPVVAALAAAAARRYPFTDRLILFLMPGLILAAAAGIGWLQQLLPRGRRVLGASVSLALVLPFIYPVAVTPPPYSREGMKSVLEYVQDRWQDDDRMYVYYGAGPAMSFYGPRYGFTREMYVVGGCHRGRNREYLAELAPFHGHRRVWIVFAQAFPEYRERADILAHLNRVGVLVDSYIASTRAVARSPLPAEAHLYDLGVLAGPLPEEDSVTGPSEIDPGLTCNEGPTAARFDFET